jgi:hypothetical protein
LVSFAVQRRGPVGSRIRRAWRSATISLMVRPIRLASAESGTLPRSEISCGLQGLLRRPRLWFCFTKIADDCSDCPPIRGTAQENSQGAGGGRQGSSS